MPFRGVIGKTLPTLVIPPATIRNNQLQGEFHAHIFASDKRDKKQV